jgi:hypothetical protein
VNENITAAFGGGDEAEALLVVEPLHSSSGHDDVPPFLKESQQARNEKAAG